MQGLSSYIFLFERMPIIAKAATNIDILSIYTNYMYIFALAMKLQIVSSPLQAALPTALLCRFPPGPGTAERIESYGT